MKNKIIEMKKTSYKIIGWAAFLSCIMVQVYGQENQDLGNPSEKMNVLFLVADDLRTDLGVYDHPIAYTPNLDRLAKEGVVFEHAYCQYPLCNPSRSSLLTGKRPTTSGLHGNREWFAVTYPDWISLPKYFKQQGYTTIRSGKIFHGGIDDTDAWDIGGEERKFGTTVNTEAPTHVDSQAYWQGYTQSKPQTEPYKGVVGSDRWEMVEGDEVDELGDTRVADRTLKYLEERKRTGEPFFLACGFYKPHTPFIAPKTFFDLYDVEDINLPPDFSSLPAVPVGFPDGAIRRRNADLFVNRTASPQEAKEFIRAYLACVSYVDWNVGRVLNHLEELGLKENTIVVFWSDHGYQLGEKGKWSKAGSLWEKGTRVPLIIYDPRAEGNGKPSTRIVELLDLYPTLLELCGLPPNAELEGTSLNPLLQKPEAQWDKPAYTVWNENGKGISGVSVRTERWRYAEFFGHGAGRYLTDAVNDPHELINLANDSSYHEVVEHLHGLALEYVKGKIELSGQRGD